MFPQEGKFNHFAQFVIISGKLLPNGKYQRPTVALLCNFPPGSGDAPSLMTHQEVETLFHEFGHALHSIVTRAKYGRFAVFFLAEDGIRATSVTGVQTCALPICHPLDNAAVVIDRAGIDMAEGQPVEED